jgi:hypothetical protein
MGARRDSDSEAGEWEESSEGQETSDGQPAGTVQKRSVVSSPR